MVIVFFFLLSVIVLVQTIMAWEEVVIIGRAHLSRVMIPMLITYILIVMVLLKAKIIVFVVMPFVLSQIKGICVPSSIFLMWACLAY